MKALDILKDLIKRKIARKHGFTANNALASSTIVGATAVSGAVLVDTSAIVDSLGLPEQYALILRIVIAGMGLYAMYTEKK